MAEDGGCEMDSGHKIYEGYKAWGALESVLSNRRVGINAKKYLYKGVNSPTVLYGAGHGA